MRPGRAADHSPPSSAEVLQEWSYTSTPLWATTGPVTGLLYLYLYSHVHSRVECSRRFVLLLRRMFVWVTSSSPSAVFQCEYTFPKWSLIFRFRDQNFEPTSAVNPFYVNRGDVIRALVKNHFVSLAEFDRLVLKIFGAQHCREDPVVQVRLAPYCRAST